MTLELNGKNIEIDFLDAEEYENYLKAANTLTKPAISTTNHSELLKSYCNVVYTYFDTLLGDGMANMIFDGKHNLRVCSECLKKCIKECINYLKNDFHNEINTVLADWADLLK